MKPLDRLSDYLSAIERRLRIVAVTRGAAVIALAALVLTVVAVIVANNFAFSNGSVAGARVFLFLGLAAAIAAALIVPYIRLNRRHAAREVEKKYPQFQERLLTFTERVEQRPNDPFLHLLAADTLDVAQQAEPKEVAKNSLIFGFSTAAVVAALVLVWLGMSGPGFLGYGTSLLWGGLPKGEMKPFYAIKVEPGNKTIRKRSDLMVLATLTGFQAPKVRFFAKYASASQWEQAEMRTEPGGTSYQFLIAGVPESLEYYIEAGGVKSETYKLNVIDLPSVKNIRVTYHFPSWLGMKDAVEDPGGDLRAVEGTVGEVAVTTDRPLTTGAILLDDGTKITLRSGNDGKLLSSVPINKDGLYHFIAVEGGEDVRLSEDYFIEAQKDQAPEIKITRPGRDFRASPIEEVTVQVEGKDDFGLKDVTLHYSVNGGPEKTIAMPAGGKESKGAATLALEDFKVVPGDVVAIYASAKDARKSVSTDMFFIEAQPFEKNYTQSQQEGGGGGGGGGGDEEQNQISQRQKEIITATWNQVKGQGAKATDSENASFLSSVQSKLRDQAKSLSDRMKARQLEGAGDSFKSFVQDMDAAVEAMAPATDKLKAANWKDALQPEQKALQHLLRAEATFRDIQVAFGQRGGGGGGGGGGATRDMQGLFDLELDTEKNQYESARSGQQQGGGGGQQAIDEALEKLKQLAKRQQELAEAQRQNKQQTPQDRWQQEQLRREAERLQQQLQQAMQNQQLSRNGQQSQSGQQGQQGQQSQSGQSGQQSGQQGQMSRNQQQQQGGQQGQQNQQQQQRVGGQQGQQSQQQLQQTLDRLKQAVDDMRQAASSQQAGTPQGEAQARRAADRLREAQQMLSGMKDQQSNNQVESLSQQAEELARKQQEFEGELRKQFGANSKGVTRDQADQLARQHEQEVADLKRLEQGMQGAVRDLQGTNRQASTKMRDALGDLQQSEIARGMQRNADWIRRGMGQYAVLSESNITAGLNELRDQLKQVQQQLAAGGGKDPKQDKQDQAMEKTLQQIEQLRRQMEQMSQQGRNGQQGQRGQQPGQLARGQQQGGQQQGGQQQGGQQQGGQQQGGQQQGGQQGGQQQGGQQQGGQQGGQQQGGQQQGGSPQGGSQQGGAFGPNGPAMGSNYGGNYGNRQFDGRTNDGPVRPQDFQQQYRNTMQSLQELQQQVQGDPNLARDIQGLMRDLRDVNPFAGNNDPLLAERISAALAGVEQVEMELRRKVEDANGGGSVRSPGGEKVPAGYADKVAEYYRKLGKSK